MTIKIIPATLLADFYKISHRMFYPAGTTEIYSTWIPRSAEYFPIETDYAVAKGFQMFNKKYLVDYFNKNFFSRPKAEIIAEYEYVIKNTLGGVVDSSHIAALHDLGYLPLEIKTLPEGTKTPIKVPTLTIVNTLPEFYWLTNYFETIMSSELWLPSNSATIAAQYRDLLDGWALETIGSTDGVEFQGHDFSFRGMQGLDSAVASGLGHLLSFTGTDNIPAIVAAEVYYGADLSKELVGTSVPATEHSIMSSFGRDEVKAFSTIIDSVPEGIVSIVSDTYDFWNVLETVLPTLKEKIMTRNGKVVIRPDSGNPIDIICGTYHYDLVFTSPDSDNPSTLQDFAPQIADYFEANFVYKLDLGQRGYLGIKLDEKVFAVHYDYDGTVYKIDVDAAEEVVLTPAQKGAIQLLWETFGGAISKKGYKLLSDKVGLLYGDAITIKRADEISAKLAHNGFASTNVVYGIGSFTYSYVTRDSLGYALKSTYAMINGKETFIEKDPKTDDKNLKKSLTGKVAVVKGEDGVLKYVDHLTAAEEKDYPGNLLRTIFKNGEIENEITFAEMKKNLHG